MFRVDAKSDWGCTGGSNPADRALPRSACSCTSQVGRTTRGALRGPSRAHCGGDFYGPLGSTPNGVAQCAQGCVRVSDQRREEGGGDGPIRMVDCERWTGVGRGSRKSQAGAVVSRDQVDGEIARVCTQISVSICDGGCLGVDETDVLRLDDLECMFHRPPIPFIHSNGSDSVD